MAERDFGKTFMAYTLLGTDGTLTWMPFFGIDLSGHPTKVHDS
jgi:hypothetical protein